MHVPKSPLNLPWKYSLETENKSLNKFNIHNPYPSPKTKRSLQLHLPFHISIYKQSRNNRKKNSLKSHLASRAITASLLNIRKKDRGMARTKINKREKVRM